MIWLICALSLILVWFLIRLWYFRQVDRSRQQLCHLDGKTVPGENPKMLVGNMVKVYRAKNSLSAYHWFHEQFGEIVQIFWLWRQQISITNYLMIRHILVDNQKNYSKFPPNSLIQRLYGNSVLTNNGDEWKRHRFLLNEVFSKKQIVGFHHIFVNYSEQLAHKWNRYIQQCGERAELNIYPELLALFLDIVGKVSIGKDFAALEGEADEFLSNLNYIVGQSIRPVHQFTTWWKYLPFPSNHKLNKAFGAIDDVLYQLIRQRKELSEPYSSNVLDLLLQATDSLETDLQPLTDKEVRDNLLAIIVNGHETVATTVALSLYLLARYPQKLTRAQGEIDKIMTRDREKLTEAGLSKLDYLNCVVLESLRFCPPMAGLQRISIDPDVLEGWSIPAEQVVGITLKPLHYNPEYFGEQPEQFHPERYLNNEDTLSPGGIVTATKSQDQCPWKKFLTPHKEDSSRRTNTGVYFPLTFGDGARKCLGEHFAMYEMKVALAVLLYHFDFQVAPNFEAELELGKFGLFLTTFPKGGIEMIISPRIH
ncbi:MAG: cytochrome P450 [Xenococcaceae cyanobacterium MO_188.B29]|nr:cytochrome P450 [Xenococcaceae cyanobacterium MO_188.B29]